MTNMTFTSLFTVIAVGLAAAGANAAIATEDPVERLATHVATEKCTLGGLASGAAFNGCIEVGVLKGMKTGLPTSTGGGFTPDYFAFYGKGSSFFTMLGLKQGSSAEKRSAPEQQQIGEQQIVEQQIVEQQIVEQQIELFVPVVPNGPSADIPLPGTVALLGLGLIGVGVARRGIRASAAAR